MNLPNKITVFRLFLAPLFFLAMVIPVWIGVESTGYLIAAWILFAVIELSDILDGYLARKWNQVTDIGKVLDPFSDVVSRVTYFICFTYLGMMPVWMLAIILYRELGQTFLRMYMIKQGVAMAANIWGKLKSALYGIACGVGLLALSIQYAGSDYLDLSFLVARIVFGSAALAAVVSFTTYLRGVMRASRS